MKLKLLVLLVLALLCFQNLNGQNYQGIRSDRTLLFSKDNGNGLIGIRVDSVKYDTDSVYYFIPYALPESISNPIHVVGHASWLGERMILDAEGTHVFYNYNGDGITIKSQAVLDEEWICYTSANMQVVAKVTEWAEDSVLSETDMVKTIGFQAKDLNGTNIDHDVNGIQIKLSENYGFIETVGFYFFPDLSSSWEFFPFENTTTLQLKGLTNPEIGIRNLSYQMCHDYQAGDEFHIVDSYSSSDYDNEELIVTKYLDRYFLGDTLAYLAYQKKKTTNYYYPNPPVVTYFEDTIVVKIEKDHFIDHLPGELVFDNEGCFDVLDEESSNGLVKYSHQGNYFFCFFPENQVFLNHYDGPVGDSKYIEGLGGPYYNNCPGEIYSSFRRLVYYKKDSVECGIPLVITAIPENQATEFCEVFQIAGQNGFGIKVQDQMLPLDYQIISISGQVIDKGRIFNNQWIYDNKEGLKGVFILSIRGYQNQQHNQKVVLY